LPMRADPCICPETRVLLYDLSRCPEHPRVVAAAGHVADEQFDDSSLRFAVRGPADTQCVVRVRVPFPPVSTTANGVRVKSAWDASSRTALIRFANLPTGVRVVVQWHEGEQST